MISNTSALPGLEVKGQGSIFASPALYKGGQNGARGQCRWVSARIGGSSVLTELEAVSREGSLGSVGGEEGRAEQSSQFSLVQSGGVDAVLPCETYSMAMLTIPVRRCI